MRKQVNEIVRIVAESLPKKIKVLETSANMRCSGLSNATVSADTELN